MKTVMVTGMPGCGMREVADNLAKDKELAREGFRIHVQDVGTMMYHIDVLGRPEPGPSREEWEEKILNRPRSALAALRKAVFQTITTRQTGLEEREETERARGDGPVPNNVVVVLVHATFFWRHDVQIGAPFASVEELDPHFFVTVVDDLERIADNLYRQERWHALSLEEMLWWRAVETTTTAAVAGALRKPHYVLAKGEDPRTLANLIAHPPPDIECVYASYPMSHVGEEELRQCQDFIEELRNHFTVFDPVRIRDVEYGRDKLFNDYDAELAVDMNKAGLQHLVELPGLGSKRATRILEDRSINGAFKSVSDLTRVPGIGKGLLSKWGPRVYVDLLPRKFDREQLERVRKQLDHQTVCRDYDLIDQSSYVIVHYTKSALEEEAKKQLGREEIMPLSPGVISEMNHAHAHHKKVYAVWQSEAEPSPFFEFYCTAWKRTAEDLLSLLRGKGVIE